MAFMSPQRMHRDGQTVVHAGFSFLSSLSRQRSHIIATSVCSSNCMAPNGGHRRAWPDLWPRAPWIRPARGRLRPRPGPVPFPSHCPPPIIPLTSSPASPRAATLAGCHPPNCVSDPLLVLRKWNDANWMMSSSWECVGGILAGYGAGTPSLVTTQQTGILLELPPVFQPPSQLTWRHLSPPARERGAKGRPRWGSRPAAFLETEQ